MRRFPPALCPWPLGLKWHYLNSYAYYLFLRNIAASVYKIRAALTFQLLYFGDTVTLLAHDLFDALQCRIKAELCFEGLFSWHYIFH